MAGIDDLLSTSGALTAFGSELKGATNSVVGLAGNLLSGSMKLSDYSKSLEQNTKLLGKLGKVVNALTMFNKMFRCSPIVLKMFKALGPTYNVLHRISCFTECFKNEHMWQNI